MQTSSRGSLGRAKRNDDVDPNATETDAAPDDRVRGRQVGPSTSGLVNPNTLTAQQKSLVPVSPGDIGKTNSNRDRKASSEALITGFPYRDHLAQGHKNVEKSHARGASEEGPSKDPMEERI